MHTPRKTTRRLACIATAPRRAHALIALLAATPVASLLAHPGHTHPPVVPPAEPAHWFVEPDHAVTWLLLGVMVWMLRRVLRTSRAQIAPVKPTKR